jgi:uridine kinase
MTLASPARAPVEAKDLARIMTSLLAASGPGVFAVTGPAGSGKTSACAALAREAPVYSADFRFIGDSAERRLLLDRKQLRSPSDYRDSANQFNWWNWDEIETDLRALCSGTPVEIAAPYDRQTGIKAASVRIAPARTVVFEGALLGPPQLVASFSKIVFLCTPEQTRLDRILGKDAGRRSFNEILARFLITEYSETIYYRNLFAWARQKLVFLDTATGHPCAAPELPENLFVPMKINP